MQNKPYVGIDKDINGGMTDKGKLIREAWAFGILPETQTCEGWMPQAFEDLWDKVHQAWEPYGFKVSNLPDDIRERYLRIQNEAVERARAAGWNPDAEFADDEA